MKLYPVHLVLEGRKALVVGGGPVAAQKAGALAESGARVLVVAARCSPEMEDVARRGGFRVILRDFRPSDLEGMSLVIAATDRADVQQAVAREAGRRGIFACAVDDPANCSFIAPAVLRRGDLILTVSTSGIAPALASRIRDKLAEVFGAEYGEALAKLAGVREELKRQHPDPQARREAWYRLVDTAILPALWKGESSGGQPEEE